MTTFNIHFFRKIKQRLEYGLLLSFFQGYDEFDKTILDDRVIFTYTNKITSHKAEFILTKYSSIIDISKIDPQYIDANFKLQFNMLIPSYISNILFEIVSKLCLKFNLFIYSEFIDNVCSANITYLNTLFSMVKEKYIIAYPDKCFEYSIYSKHSLDNIFEYIIQYDKLQSDLKYQNIILPKYHFLKDSQNFTRLAIEWEHNTQIVLPPHIDYVFYIVGNENRIYLKKELDIVLKDIYQSVPGFLKDAKLIKKESFKKINKLLKKYDFSNIDQTFTRSSLLKITD